MLKPELYLTRLFPVILLLAAAACSRGPEKAQVESAAHMTVLVAQKGEADVLGTDNTALQKAADMLKAGDTLIIGPGEYVMENSLNIPSGVVVRGTPGKTILQKGPGVESFLIDGGDYGERKFVVAEPEKFRAGMGISIVDETQRSCWDVTVATITEVAGDSLRTKEMAIRDYTNVDNHTQVRNAFSLICIVEAKDVVLEGITVDGNKEENSYLTGCRGSAIFLYDSRDVTVRNCVARNFNGDGISFRTKNMRILDCEVYGNTGIGIHPGFCHHSEIKRCHIHDNGSNGMYVCWQVRYGHFADNLIENNGRNGISIGHKDTDNLFTGNTITGNRVSGVHFRRERYEKNGAHRNVFRQNTVLNNGDSKSGYGFYIEPTSRDLVIEDNRIAETRSGSERTQRYGVYVTKGAGPVELRDNTMEGHIEKDRHDENAG